MQKVVPIILTILIAGLAGFAAGRSTAGLEARMAASGAAIAANEGCAALARGQWPIGAGGPSLEARAFGPDCARATVVLVVGGLDGPLYQAAFPASRVFGLADAQSQETMTAALSEWLTPKGPRTTADLPPWPPGAPGPEGEFPFYPTPDLTRDTYEELRGFAEPVFCLPQGMESALCLRALDGGVEEIGVQAFPG
jgi:hypothetical protein